MKENPCLRLLAYVTGRIKELLGKNLKLILGVPARSAVAKLLIYGRGRSSRGALRADT